MHQPVFPVVNTIEAMPVKFTLKQLQIFLEVARHENISRAAEHLHMSQSAASEALLNLEHSYEVAGNRLHRRVEPDAGERPLHVDRVGQPAQGGGLERGADRREADQRLPELSAPGGGEPR